MENKKDRLLLESDVIAAVDKHTNSYNRLDNDITCILEEVKGANVKIVNKHKGDVCLSFGVPTQPTVPPMPEVKKRKSKFPTIRKVLDKYDDIEDNTPNILRALPYAIYKDLNSDDIEEFLWHLKFFEHNFYCGSKFQEYIKKQIEKEIGE